MAIIQGGRKEEDGESPKKGIWLYPNFTISAERPRFISMIPGGYRHITSFENTIRHRYGDLPSEDSDEDSS